MQMMTLMICNHPKMVWGDDRQKSLFFVHECVVGSLLAAHRFLKVVIELPEVAAHGSVRLVVWG